MSENEISPAGAQKCADRLTSNAEVDWDEFNPQTYKEHNYGFLRGDDRQIIEIVRDHFATVPVRPGMTGIDVGAGPNLYPTLAMLPLCDSIELYEWSSRNVDWLRGQIQRQDQSWDHFWAVLEENPRYRSVPRAERMRRIAKVTHGSIFALPANQHQWDVATMFFVAESLVQRTSEFQNAVEHFASCVKPGGIFAAAFMKDSSGYVVDGRPFPAVAVTRTEVVQAFKPCGVTVEIHEIGIVDNVRDGYGGMLVVTGRKHQD